MKTMWAPWRSEYINSNNDKDKPKSDVCVFCDALTTEDDHERHIIYRGKTAFVILNNAEASHQPPGHDDRGRAH